MKKNWLNKAKREKEIVLHDLNRARIHRELKQYGLAAFYQKMAGLHRETFWMYKKWGVN